MEALLPSVSQGESHNDRNILVQYVNDIERYTTSVFEAELEEHDLPSIMQILDAIPELSDDHKLMVAGRLFGDLSYRDLSEYTGLSLKTCFDKYKEAIKVLGKYK